MNAEYRGLQNWKFALSIVNALNRQPPYDSGALLYFQATRRTTPSPMMIWGA